MISERFWTKGSGYAVAGVLLFMAVAVLAETAAPSSQIVDNSCLQNIPEGLHDEGFGEVACTQKPTQ